MSPNRLPLERKILAAFKQAYTEQQLDVAEHLVRALETFDPDWEPGSASAEAYITVCADRRPGPGAWLRPKSRVLFRQSVRHQQPRDREVLTPGE